MKTGTARYAKHYEIAAYGESAMRWGYNYWWSKAFLIGFNADTFKNSGRTTEADVISGWGMTCSIHDVLNARTRADNRCRSGADVPNEFARTIFYPFPPELSSRKILTLDSPTGQRFPPPCSTPAARQVPGTQSLSSALLQYVEQAKASLCRWDERPPLHICLLR